MARVRDEYNHWTHEASDYSKQIESKIEQMLKLGEDMGFNNEDIFYMIVTEVNAQQLLRMLEK